MENRHYFLTNFTDFKNEGSMFRCGYFFYFFKFFKPFIGDQTKKFKSLLEASLLARSDAARPLCPRPSSDALALVIMSLKRTKMPGNIYSISRIVLSIF